MILLNKKELKDKHALNKHKAYLQSLLNEGRPNVSPSSQEWVSDEYYQGHRQLLLDEIREINKLLRNL